MRKVKYKDYTIEIHQSGLNKKVYAYVIRKGGECIASTNFAIICKAKGLSEAKRYCRNLPF